MSAFSGPYIPTENLSLNLDPGNEKSWPGSGTTWFDISGNDNHATLTGTPSFFSNYVTWNGTSQFATITANQNSLDFRNEQTVVIWMKHSFTSGRRNPWDQAYGGYGTWTHEAGNNINGYYGTAGTNTTPYTSTNSGSTARDVWNCIVRGRNTSQVFWWINGVRTQTSNNAYGVTGTTTANIRIARGYAGYWQGDMGQVLAYNRCLTDEEVKEVYSALRGRYT